MAEPPESLEAGDHFRFFSEVNRLCGPEDVPAVPAGERVSLVATVPRYGFLFTAQGGLLHVYSSAALSCAAGNCSPQQSVWCGGRITHISRTSDSLTLIVVAVWTDDTPHLLFFDMRTLAQQGGWQPYLQCSGCSSIGSRVTALVVNPTDPNCVAFCCSNGDLTVLSLSENSVSYNTKRGIGAGAIGWSAKGKQVCVGCSNGSLALFKPDLTPVRVIAAPQHLPPPIAVTSLVWFTNTEFFVAYQHLDMPSLMYVNGPKGAEPQFVCYDDVCYTSDSSVPHYYHFAHIPDWNQLFVLSSGGVEMAALVKTSNGSWSQMFMDEGNRAEMHFVNVTQETYALGMALDFASTKIFAMKEDQVEGPFPVIYTMSTGGEINIFHMRNKLPDKGDLCAANPTEKLPGSIGVRTAQQYGINISIPPPPPPPQTSGGVGGGGAASFPTMGGATPVLTSAISPGTASTAYALTALAGGSSAFTPVGSAAGVGGEAAGSGDVTSTSSLPVAGAALIKPSIGGGGGLFGSMTSSTSTAPGGSLLGAPSTAPTLSMGTSGGSVFGGSVPPFSSSLAATQAPTSSLFGNRPPTASALGGSSLFAGASSIAAGGSSSLFGGSVSASSTALAGSNTAAVPSPFGAGPAASSTPSLFGGNTAAGSTPSLFGGKTPGSTAAPSLFGGSSAPAVSTPSLFSSIGGGAAGTTSSMFGGSTNTSSTVTEAAVAPTSAKVPSSSSAFSFPTSVASSASGSLFKGGSVASVPSLLGGVPTPASPVNSSSAAAAPHTPKLGRGEETPSASPSEQRTSAVAAAVVKEPPVEVAPKPKSRTEQQNKAIIEQILHEQNLFEKEMREHFGFSEQVEYKGGWEASMGTLQEALHGTESALKQHKLDCQNVSDSVAELHAAVLEFYSNYEDAKAQCNRLKDPKQAYVLEWRGLDRCSERRLQELRNKLHYMQSELSYANATLDTLATARLNKHNNDKNRRQYRGGRSPIAAGSGSAAEDVYKTVLLTHNVRVACEKQLDDLTNKMNNLTTRSCQILGGSNVSTKSNGVNTGGRYGITDNSLMMPDANTSNNKENISIVNGSRSNGGSSGLTPSKQEQLVMMLQDRRTTPLRKSSRAAYNPCTDAMRTPPPISRQQYGASDHVAATTTSPLHHHVPATLHKLAAPSPLLATPTNNSSNNTPNRSLLSMSMFGPNKCSTPAEATPVGNSKFGLRELLGEASLQGKPTLGLDAKALSSDVADEAPDTASVVTGAPRAAPASSSMTFKMNALPSYSNATNSLKTEVVQEEFNAPAEGKVTPKYEDITPPETPDIPNDVATDDQATLSPSSSTNPLSALSMLVGRVPPFSFTAQAPPVQGFFSSGGPTLQFSSKPAATSASTEVNEPNDPGLVSGKPFALSSNAETAPGMFSSGLTSLQSSGSAFTKAGASSLPSASPLPTTPNISCGTSASAFSFSSAGFMSSISTTTTTSALLPKPASVVAGSVGNPLVGTSSATFSPSANSSTSQFSFLPKTALSSSGQNSVFGGSIATTVNSSSLFNTSSTGGITSIGSTLSVKQEPSINLPSSIAPTIPEFSIPSNTSLSAPIAAAGDSISSPAIQLTPISTHASSTTMSLGASNSGMFSTLTSITSTGAASPLMVPSPVTSPTSLADALFAPSAAPVTPPKSLLGSLGQNSALTLTPVTPKSNTNVPTAESSVSITPVTNAVSSSTTFFSVEKNLVGSEATSGAGSSLFAQASVKTTTALAAPITSSSSPFGSTTSGSSSLFAAPTTTTTTISSSSLFGSQPLLSTTTTTATTVATTLASGTLFGATSGSSTSLFGSTPTNSLFGSTATSGASVFGAPASVGSSSPFGGGATAATSSGGGGGSVFGTASVASSSTSAFGAPGAIGSSSAFGGPPSAGGSVFGGAPSAAAAAAVPSSSSSGSVFGQSNTGGGSVFGGASAGTSSVFGGSAAPTGSVFGGAAPPTTGSVFGGTAAGASTTVASVFGGAGSSGGASVFGGSSSGTSAFGGNSNTGGSTTVFGNKGVSPSVFGGGSTTSVFGGAGATTSTSGGGSVFGGSGGGSFGGNTSVFGAAAPAPGGSSLFGAKPAAPFGSPAGFGAAGAGSSGGAAAAGAAGGSLFGSNNSSSMFTGLGSKPSTPSNKNVFGISSGTVKPQTDLFGGGGGSPAVVAPVAPSVFGGNAAAQARSPSAAFGGAATFGSPPKFGSSTAFGSSPAFGGAPGGGSTFGGGSVFGGSSAAAAGAPANSGGGFSNFASAPGAATFGGLAANSGTTGGFGNSGPSSAFPQNNSGGGSSSFTSWR